MRMVRQQIILDITNIRTSLWVLTRKDRQKPQKKISLDGDCVFHGDHIKPLIRKGISPGSVLSISLKPFSSASYASAEAGRPEKPNWRIGAKPVRRQINQ